MFGIGEAYAMGGGQPGAGSSAGGAGLFLQLLPFILMFVVIYLLILRPQYKKQKQHQSMIDALKKGDRVVTSGGVYGKIVGMKEKEGILVLQVAKDVQIEVSRGSVSRLAEEKK